MVQAATPPAYRGNVYTSAAILDPYPHYRNLRRLGPVVWLPRHKVHALPRYRECKAVLRDDTTFISAGGVALNPISNRFARGGNLLSWAAATFDCLGPANAGMWRGFPSTLQMLLFARRVVRSGKVVPGSMTDELLGAARAGALPARECPALMVDYLGPALDTIISAISSALSLFATHPSSGICCVPSRSEFRTLSTRSCDTSHRYVPSPAASAPTPRSPAPPCGSSWNGTLRTRSTSPGTPAVISASGRASMPAPARHWPA